MTALKILSWLSNPSNDLSLEEKEYLRENYPVFYNLYLGSEEMRPMPKGYNS